MSEKLANIKKKGGGGQMTETVLWTNPSPTTSFTLQTITLSENFTNYDYVRIYLKGSRTDNTECMIEVPSDKLKAAVTSVAYRPNIYIGGYDGNGTYQYVRRISYITDSSLSINSSYRINAAATNDNLFIPIKITGIK